MSSPRFESPFAVRAPDGAEGWERLYPYHGLFSAERRAAEEDRFWFMDGMHLPEPLPPFDAGVIDSAFMALGQVNTRIFCVPAALGIDHRFLNGYLYLSVNTVTDPEEIERRASLFAARAGHYYKHWDELYARWVQKVEADISDLASLFVPDLPDVEDESVVLSGRGVGSADALLVAYNRCLEGIHFPTEPASMRRSEAPGAASKGWPDVPTTMTAGGSRSRGPRRGRRSTRKSRAGGMGSSERWSRWAAHIAAVAKSSCAMPASGATPSAPMCCRTAASSAGPSCSSG